MTREEAITHLEDMKKGLFPWSDIVTNEICDMAISALSEEDNTMEWIRIYPDDDMEMYECSCCGETRPFTENFCPACGKKAVIK